MTDEKAKAIEILNNLLKDEDPYINPFGNLFKIEADAIRIAIAALCNQPESVRPKIEQSDNSIRCWNWFVCGNCGTAIKTDYKFCYKCGAKVLWPEVEE